MDAGGTLRLNEATEIRPLYRFAVMGLETATMAPELVDPDAAHLLAARSAVGHVSSTTSRSTPKGWMQRERIGRCRGKGHPLHARKCQGRASSRKLIGNRKKRSRKFLRLLNPPAPRRFGSTARNRSFPALEKIIQRRGGHSGVAMIRGWVWPPRQSQCSQQRSGRKHARAIFKGSRASFKACTGRRKFPATIKNITLGASSDRSFDGN